MDTSHRISRCTPPSGTQTRQPTAEAAPSHAGSSREPDTKAGWRPPSPLTQRTVEALSAGRRKRAREDEDAGPAKNHRPTSTAAVQDNPKPSPTADLRGALQTVDTDPASVGVYLRGLFPEFATDYHCLGGDKRQQRIEALRVLAGRLQKAAGKDALRAATRAIWQAVAACAHAGDPAVACTDEAFIALAEAEPASIWRERGRPSLQRLELALHGILDVAPPHALTPAAVVALIDPEQQDPTHPLHRVLRSRGLLDAVGVVHPERLPSVVPPFSGLWGFAVGAITAPGASAESALAQGRVLAQSLGGATLEADTAWDIAIQLLAGFGPLMPGSGISSATLSGSSFLRGFLHAVGRLPLAGHDEASRRVGECMSRIDNPAPGLSQPPAIACLITLSMGGRTLSPDALGVLLSARPEQDWREGVALALEVDTGALDPLALDMLVRHALAPTAARSGADELGTLLARRMTPGPEAGTALLRSMVRQLDFPRFAETRRLLGYHLPRLIHGSGAQDGSGLHASFARLDAAEQVGVLRILLEGSRDTPSAHCELVPDTVARLASRFTVPAHAVGLAAAFQVACTEVGVALLDPHRGQGALSPADFLRLVADNSTGPLKDLAQHRDALRDGAALFADPLARLRHAAPTGADEPLDLPSAGKPVDATPASWLDSLKQEEASRCAHERDLLALHAVWRIPAARIHGETRSLKGDEQRLQAYASLPPHDPRRQLQALLCAQDIPRLTRWDALALLFRLTVPARLHYADVPLASRRILSDLGELLSGDKTAPAAAVPEEQAVLEAQMSVRAHEALRAIYLAWPGSADLVELDWLGATSDELGRPNRRGATHELDRARLPQVLPALLKKKDALGSLTSRVHTELAHLKSHATLAPGAKLVHGAQRDGKAQGTPTPSPAELTLRNLYDFVDQVWLEVDRAR